MGKRTGRMNTRVAVALVLLFFIPAAGLCADAGAGGLGQAMNAFVQAMVSKDSQGVLAAFSPQQPWRFVGYEIGTGRQNASNMVNFAQMSNDFQTRGGWYHFFFDEPNGYTFRLNFLKGVKWKKQGTTFHRASKDKSVRHYIKWRQEGGRWVIAEIGDTSP